MRDKSKQLFLLGLTIIIALSIFSDWDNFKRGIAGKPEKDITVQKVLK